jgi:hypothetical protein
MRPWSHLGRQLNGRPPLFVQHDGRLDCRNERFSPFLRREESPVWRCFCTPQPAPRSLSPHSRRRLKAARPSQAPCSAPVTGHTKSRRRLEMTIAGVAFFNLGPTGLRRVASGI